jgi:hypothetical protein
MQLLLLGPLFFSYNHSDTVGEFSPRTETGEAFCKLKSSGPGVIPELSVESLRGGRHFCLQIWLGRRMSDRRNEVLPVGVVRCKKFPEAFTSYSGCAFITLMHGYSASFFTVSQVLMRLPYVKSCSFSCFLRNGACTRCNAEVGDWQRRVELGYKFLHACQSNRAKKWQQTYLCAQL